MLSKINRVGYGMLSKADMALVDANTPESRKLVAVPFVGKDVPSHASEFAHPDVLIGLTSTCTQHSERMHSNCIVCHQISLVLLSALSVA